MSVLENTVNQAIADFDSIEAAIKDMGVEVPQGTDTSEYAQKIRNVAKAKYDSGYNDGVEAGKQAEYDTLWNGIQDNGTRTNYEYAFNHWGMDIKPKYKVVSKRRDIGMLEYSHITEIKKTDFDFSQGICQESPSTYGHYATFRNCSKLTVIEDIGLKAGYYYYTFTQCTKLHTIEKIRCSENSVFELAFSNCNSLKNISIEGVIGKNINFSYSPLTVESMKNVIMHLKDYSGTDKSGTYKVTFTSACLDALDAEGATSPNNNTWRQYINDLGWSC